MNLKEAIAEMEAKHKRQREEGWAPWPHEIIVLAAARAFACKRCEGTGWIFRASPPYETYIDEHCPDCRVDREKVSGT